jgi:guanylate cyclase soluble subunit beta
MIWLEDVNHILFIGSPRLASLSDMEERQLYLSGIPLYDVTRELVLLNQQRIAELQSQVIFPLKNY